MLSNRKLRRLAEHQARKAARKAGIPYVPPQQPAAAEPAEESTNTTAPPSDQTETTASSILDGQIPEPGIPFPAFSQISQARVEANRRNSLHSTGAKSEATKAVSAQNHTSHGMARHHQENFKLLTSEDPAHFESLQTELLNQHQPANETERILVVTMAQSHWLTQRAQRLQDTCMNPDTGAVTDDKKFSLYLRYFNTHKRLFHQSVNDLAKLRADQRKAEIGFEAQRVQTERHEMKKQEHYWHVLRKDGEACYQISTNTLLNMKANKECPGFEAKYEAELAKRGLQNTISNVAAVA